MRHDTIVALSTPPGRGGIGIIRLSGPNAAKVSLQFIVTKTLRPRQINYAAMLDSNGEIIDQGIVLYFNAPHSFTGEDVIELQCHGSPIILDRLIQRCVALGARIANPGEFSERAFLNNKIDLVQAEAIADLINANSVTATRMAMKSIQGEFSNKIHAINKRIIQLRTMIEGSLDFSEEEIEWSTDTTIELTLTAIQDNLFQIQRQATSGSILRDGLTVVIAGAPNVGKSTLINQLAQREIAIVTEIAGTTRDVMRDQILLDDIPIQILDTAGLRDTTDLVELEGIKRAWLAISAADCVLMVSDIQQLDYAITPLIAKITQAVAPNVPIIHIINKIDLKQPPLEDDKIFISAKMGYGITTLVDKIKQMANFSQEDSLYLARRRHLTAIANACTYLSSGQQIIQQNRARELLAEDLRLAHRELSVITGEFTTEDLLGEIFANFCIGK